MARRMTRRSRGSWDGWVMGWVGYGRRMMTLTPGLIGQALLGANGHLTTLCQQQYPVRRYLYSLLLVIPAVVLLLTKVDGFESLDAKYIAVQVPVDR